MHYAIGICFALVLLTPFHIMAKHHVIHVDDFRTHTDAEDNATPAIQAAIMAALDIDAPVEIQFSEHVYTLDTMENARFHIEVINASNLTINGNNATLLLRNPMAGGILFQESQNCTLRNITIDYETVPFTQGEVVDVRQEKGYFVLRLDSGFPDLMEPWMLGTLEDTRVSQLGGFGMQRERDTFRLKRNAVSAMALERWESISQQTYRIYPASAAGLPLPWGSLEPGDDFVYVMRNNGAAVFFMGCEDGYVDNVTVYAAPSAAVIGDSTNGLRVNRLQVLVKPQSGRINSINGDGVHVAGARRGPIIENSIFEGMADDGTNTYASPYILREILSDTEVIVRGWRPIKPGDQMDVFDPINGVNRATSKAREVHKMDKHALWRLVFDAPVKGMIAGDCFRSADHLYNRNASGKGLIIRNCVYRSFRGRGNVVQTAQVLIENNRYEHLSGIAIHVANSPDWPEGHIAADVIITGNTFHDIGYPGHQGGHPQGGVINVMGMRLGHVLSRGLGPRKIHIVGNTIHNWPLIGIYLGSVKDAVVKGNTFTADDDAFTYNNHATGVVLENVSNVRIVGNSIIDRRNIAAALCIRDTGEAENIQVGNAFDAQLNSGVPVVLDRR